MICKDVFINKLNELKTVFDSVKDTPMGMKIKVINLIVLNMRYEEIAFNNKLKKHPYLLTRDLIEEQINIFKAFKQILFIQDNKEPNKIFELKEEKHKKIWNALWNKYDDKSYEMKVERYKKRIRINKLESLIRGKDCLDMGSGHGTFSYAMLELGAKSVRGIDYSKESVNFSNKIRLRRPNKEHIKFINGSVYKVPYKDNSFDFVVQNGVFHHLAYEDKAIDEAVRVLKKGGFMWYYTDGEGSISSYLWDASVHILRNTPIELVQEVTKAMNISVNKSYHLGDSLKATYKHTSWNKITAKLRSKGFTDFKRMKGGFITDLDGDTVKYDPYAREKFGEGDIRLIAKLKKD